MKKLVIYQENNEPIVLFDNDNLKIETYCKEAEKVFHSQTISTIHTTEGSLVLRPGKLLSILVQDILDQDLEKIESEIEIKPPQKRKTRAKKKTQTKKEEIDIIKDVD